MLRAIELSAIPSAPVATFFAILASVAMFAQASVPERKVDGTTIISDRDPSLRIELPRSAVYVGGDRWVLYGNANCELHAFVQADAQENVQRLYWVQFEGYLPSKPGLHHTYDSPRHAQIGGLDFYVDTWPRARNTKIDPGSDREHIEALIQAKGFRMPASMMYVRFVHLLDQQKRKELMIIYGEDLAPTAFSADELEEGGTARSAWPGIEKGLIERAEMSITLHAKGAP